MPIVRKVPPPKSITDKAGRPKSTAEDVSAMLEMSIGITREDAIKRLLATGLTPAEIQAEQERAATERVIALVQARESASPKTPLPALSVLPPEMPQRSENLRCLLWLKHVPRKEWIVCLGRWAGCGIDRAVALLQGAAANQDELARIARAVGLSAETLVGTSLLITYKINVLRENIWFLINPLDRKNKQKLATALDIDPITITEWYNGAARPQAEYFAAICRYFGLPTDTDLEKEALFLFLDVRLDGEQRAWVQRYLDQLDPLTWRMAYPFLKFFLEHLVVS